MASRCRCKKLIQGDFKMRIFISIVFLTSLVAGCSTPETSPSPPVKPKVAFSEKVVPRGNPQNVTHRIIEVHIPPYSEIISIKGYMKNEPWGGAQNPTKPNTDDMGTTHYIECPMRENQECSIGWSKVDASTVETKSDGGQIIRASFKNWYARNDRTGKLEVIYNE